MSYYFLTITRSIFKYGRVSNCRLEFENSIFAQQNNLEKWDACSSHIDLNFSDSQIIDDVFFEYLPGHLNFTDHSISPDCFWVMAFLRQWRNHVDWYCFPIYQDIIYITMNDRETSVCENGGFHWNPIILPTAAQVFCLRVPSLKIERAMLSLSILRGAQPFVTYIYF